MIIIQGKKIRWWLLTVLFSLILPNVAYAEDNQATYFVKPLLTENQRKDVADYFDIQLSPDGKQTLQLEIHNNTAEKMTFATVIENAITNDHGVIEYQHDAKEYDQTLKHQLTDLAKVEETIEVDGGSVGKVEVAVTMPGETFDGIVLGGIRVSEKLSEENQKQSGISNVFSYVIPIKLWQNDTVIPNKLNFKGVTIGQQSFENVIKARLQNPQAAILRGLTLEAKVFKKNGQAVYEEKQEEMKLAPNSSFDYAISLGTNEFKAGKYYLELTAKAEDLNETWKEEFEITGKEAKELNDELVFKKQTNLGIYGLAAAFLVAVFVIGCLLYRQKKWQEKSKETMETKKMKKRKRTKKQSKKVLIFLLAVSGFTLGHRASAETEGNNGLSDATILIKPKETGTTETQSSSSTTDDTTTSDTTTSDTTTNTTTTGKTTTGKTTSGTTGKTVSTGKKTLPQTGETTNKQLVSLGSVILLCATTVFIKTERGKQDEE
ncbi:DUF3324 domain-containing protein [Vagococcus sp. BWB3-3]|uniref:DUF3324 domain-containing protein n=1 Tax=Vagococcus allomyrinae TaxID=2794353 RepID=A0A940P6J7_9ENTE|nr:DUF3324 domain-containing protein [Vagococcus allomyrinae]